MKLSNVKKILKKSTFLWPFTRVIYRWLDAVFSNPILCWPRFAKYFLDWVKFNKDGGCAHIRDLYPCLHDRTENTKFDPQYFYQAVWAMGEINAKKPALHIDIASDIKFVGMLSTITQVEFLDIRPLVVNLEKLKCLEGTILELPFGTNSVESLSCLHVVEHVGLGRYGDPIDPLGVEKACSELSRVLKVDGYLYLSLPLGTPRVQFNGLRTFSINEVVELFPNLKLVSSALVDNFGKFHGSIDLAKVEFNEKQGNDFALGCFVFRKNI